jgi:hypothetical protein
VTPGQPAAADAKQVPALTQLGELTPRRSLNVWLETCSLREERVPRAMGVGRTDGDRDDYSSSSCAMRSA